MMERRIVVIGAAGEMASVGLERFVTCNDDCSFELYDLDTARMQQLAARLPEGMARIAEVDLFDAGALQRAIQGASLVILGAGPYTRTAPPVMRACVEEGVDYLDFDDEVESTLDGFELHDDAQAAGVALMIGCGASPGMSNVIALDVVTRLDQVRSIDVCWVTGDEGARPYGNAAIEHVLHIGAGPCVTWRDGQQVTVEGFVENEVFPMGGEIGDHRLYETAHPEAVTLPRRVPGVRSVRVMGGAYPQPVNGLIRGVALAVEQGRMTVPEAVEWLQAVMQDEFGSLKGWRYALSGMMGQVRRGESSLGVLGRYLWQAMRGQHTPYRGGILVRATGTRNGETVTIEARTPTGGPDSFLASSMAAITGTCLAAFATLALERRRELQGTLAPEDWVEPREFYETLERLGVPSHEMLVDMGLDRSRRHGAASRHDAAPGPAGPDAAPLPRPASPGSDRVHTA
jgi:saccharopine dehydrogenase-like NADP-dependent oxidoreductase